jgi:hypothetical protein
MSIEGPNNSNGNEQHSGLGPLDTMPKVVTQLTINLHNGGRVSGSMPTDMKVAMYMLGEFLKQIGPAITYSPPSPIIAPPAGLAIKGGGK